jgi:hypothetical protein
VTVIGLKENNVAFDFTNLGTHHLHIGKEADASSGGRLCAFHKISAGSSVGRRDCLLPFHHYPIALSYVLGRLCQHECQWQHEP